jgi:hypothetical protein
MIPPESEASDLTAAEGNERSNEFGSARDL